MCFIHPRRALLLASLLLLGVAACASGGGGGSDGPRRGSGNRITPDELEAVSQFDLYTAIGRLRPMWLRAGPRGVPQVVVNGAAQNQGLDALRSIRSGEVTALEYMGASDATTRFGTGFQGGAILVSTGR